MCCVGFRKPRPAIEVGIDPINDLRPDLLMPPRTKRPDPLGAAIPAPARTTGRKWASNARCEAIGPADKCRSKAGTGRLSRAELQQVEEGLERVAGLP